MRFGIGGGRGDSGGLLLIGAAVLTLAWPWLLGSWVAVQFGAANPSTTRTVVGWVFELPWLVFLVVAAVRAFRRYTERQAALAAYRAPRAVAGPGGRAVYHHASCTINHRTPDAATKCRNTR